MFVPPGVRKGVLPRMLAEILETRIMVKNAMKRAGAAQRNLQVRPPSHSPTAMKILRIVILRFGKARQKRVLK